MRLLISVIILFSLTFCSNAQAGSSSWQSNFRQLKFTYDKPWQILPTLDTKGKTLTGVIDQNDGTSIVIQITDDISKDKLSDDSYFNGLKKVMLDADSRNSLLSEDSIMFHNREAKRQTYLLYTQKWGLLKQENVVIRTGREFASVQFSYPVNKDNAKEKSLPEKSIAFDKTIELDIKKDGI